MAVVPLLPPFAVSRPIVAHCRGGAVRCGAVVRCAAAGGRCLDCAIGERQRNGTAGRGGVLVSDSHILTFTEIGLAFRRAIGEMGVAGRRGGWISCESRARASLEPAWGQRGAVPSLSPFYLLDALPREPPRPPRPPPHSHGGAGRRDALHAPLLLKFVKR